MQNIKNEALKTQYNIYVELRKRKQNDIGIRVWFKDDNEYRGKDETYVTKGLWDKKQKSDKIEDKNNKKEDLKMEEEEENVQRNRLVRRRELRMVLRWKWNENYTREVHFSFVSCKVLLWPTFIFGANPNLFGAFFRLSPPAAAL